MGKSCFAFSIRTLGISIEVQFHSLVPEHWQSLLANSGRVPRQLFPFFIFLFTQEREREQRERESKAEVVTLDIFEDGSFWGWMPSFNKPIPRKS